MYRCSALPSLLPFSCAGSFLLRDYYPVSDGFSVWVKRGLCSADSLINILLFVLGYIPGLIHAWYIIARYPEEYEPIDPSADDYENGRVTYYYVSRDPLPPQQPGPAASGAPDGGRAHRQLQRGPSYGAIRSQAQGDAHGQGPAQPAEPPTQEQQQKNQGEAEGSGRPPPSYAEAVKGDNKIQTGPPPPPPQGS